MGRDPCGTKYSLVGTLLCIMSDVRKFGLSSLIHAEEDQR